MSSQPDIKGKPAAEEVEVPEKYYYRIKILHSNETQVCGWSGNDLDRGSQVIVKSRYGKDIGRVLGQVCSKCIHDRKTLSDIIRIATDKDRGTYEKNVVREKEAMKICREKAKQHGLDMKIVSAHFLAEESKVLYFFTADERVDFRSLVKDLVSVFKMRIELRQIGVRDESRVLGGLAVCGRSYCCHGITDKLKPVSIRMAKEQNLSLNSMKISGPCGRLLCCLSYEYDFYREEKGKLPSEGSRMKIDGAFFRVQEVNLLTKNIRLTAQDGRIRDLPFSSFLYNEKSERWDVITEENGQGISKNYYIPHMRKTTILYGFAISQMHRMWVFRYARQQLRAPYNSPNHPENFILGYG